jgi:hypothetical protein
VQSQFDPNDLPADSINAAGKGRTRNESTQIAGYQEATTRAVPVRSNTAGTGLTVTTVSTLVAENGTDPSLRPSSLVRTSFVHAFC